MKNTKDFEIKTQIALQKLEDYRIEVVGTIERMKQLIPMPIGLFFITLITYFAGAHNQIVLPIILIILMAIGIFYWGLIIHEDKLLERYRNEIVAMYVEHFYPQINYFPDNYTYKHLLTGCTFWGSHNPYKAENFFMGKTSHDYHFLFFETTQLLTSNQQNPRDLFWSVHHPTIHYKQIVLLPKQQNLPSFVDDTVKAFKRRAVQLTHFSAPNQAFNRYFDVFSAEEDEVLHLLTDDFCQAIMELQKQHQLPMAISLVRYKLYCWIYNQNKYFEINSNQPIEEQQIDKKLHGELSNCFDTLNRLSSLLNQQKPFERITPKDDNANNSAYDHFFDSDNP